MGTSKDPADEVAARFLADLQANATRTADQWADPAWHAMALVAFELFGESAGKNVIVAPRLVARSPEEVDAGRAEIGAVIEALGEAGPAPPPA
jgi:hypothetical protein